MRENLFRSVPRKALIERAHGCEGRHMTATNSQGILRHIRRLAGEREPTLSDGELLGHYATSRDQSAFAELVRRHGAMVFAVCRSVLRRHDDAEDAFQAAFLIRRVGPVRSVNRKL